jgi:hypothetical protein
MGCNPFFIDSLAPAATPSAVSTPSAGTKHATWYAALQRGVTPFALSASNECLEQNIPKSPVFHPVASVSKFHRNSATANRLREKYRFTGRGRAVRLEGVIRFSLNAL